MSEHVIHIPDWHPTPHSLRYGGLTYREVQKLISAYRKTKSIWKAADRVGISGQRAHRYLKRCGLIPDHALSEHEKSQIANLYREGFIRGDGKFKRLCKELGRRPVTLQRVARKLGLTTMFRPLTEESKQKNVSTLNEYRATNGHPRGSLGMRHTEETKRKMSTASIQMWKRMPGEVRDGYSKRASITAKKALGNRESASWKAGWREIGGHRKYYRSRWEANYARYLEWLLQRGEIASWEHEPETFWFEGIKRGCMSYLPDFRVTENHGVIVYHEVKGWMDVRSRTVIKRMAKYHPAVKLIVIDGNAYRSIKRAVSSIIEGWES